MCERTASGDLLFDDPENFGQLPEDPAVPVPLTDWAISKCSASGAIPFEQQMRACGGPTMTTWLVTLVVGMVMPGVVASGRRRRAAAAQRVLGV